MNENTRCPRQLRHSLRIMRSSAYIFQVRRLQSVLIISMHP